MSTTYTGVGGNVSQSTSPTITVPADGDSLAVTSVNVALDKLMDYVALLFGGAQTGQTSTTPGYAGTGGASAQGLKATAGGGSSPVKGALNLVPTTNAPSAPVDGDMWMTTGGLMGARINGTTQLIGRQSAITESGFVTVTMTVPGSWTNNNIQYWKDPTGIVHLRGFATVNTIISASTNIFSLPAGFQPGWSQSRSHVIWDESAASVLRASIGTGGGFTLNLATVNAHIYYFDGITFLAEQ